MIFTSIMHFPFIPWGGGSQVTAVISGEAIDIEPNDIHSAATLFEAIFLICCFYISLLALFDPLVHMEVWCDPSESPLKLAETSGISSVFRDPLPRP